jgi:hypothetical protein
MLPRGGGPGGVAGVPGAAGGGTTSGSATHWPEKSGGLCHPAPIATDVTTMSAITDFISLIELLLVSGIKTMSPA